MVFWDHSTVNIPKINVLVTDCGGLTLATCDVPNKLLYHSLSSTGQVEKI